MTERLHFHFSLSCLGEGNGNPLQCSCLENPRDGGAWWAAVYGVAQSWTRLKRFGSKSHQVCSQASRGSRPWFWGRQHGFHLSWAMTDSPSSSSSVVQDVQFTSVTQSCPTLCDPMNRSTPGLPVHHQLPEFTQTHVHQVSYAIQLSHPLSSPSPPAPDPSQHQGLF